eukprot:CAMPEP_0175009690 /NCGR_PEP_ID=MMETSP0005-20121125/7692_1 /TAXON_ID=420556 /ORGANISM="Ochromonas sp., Strain CCMP1393" /LENGTH=177 /DNA_ID=CAMNT_0016265441 /DNA_START=391 /DNA_END=925 /DNA_ORIENTATION=-
MAHNLPRPLQDEVELVGLLGNPSLQILPSAMGGALSPYANFSQMVGGVSSSATLGDDPQLHSTDNNRRYKARPNRIPCVRGGFAAIQPNVTTWFDSFPCGLYASPMKSLIRLGDNGELLLSMQQHTTGSLAFAYSAISPQVMELFAGTNSLRVKGSSVSFLIWLHFGYAVFFMFAHN